MSDNEEEWNTIPVKQKNKKKTKGIRPVSNDKHLKEVLDHKKEQWANEQNEYLKQLVTNDLNTWSFKINDKNHIIGDTNSNLPVKQLRYIGGVDISFIKNNEVDACACFVILSFPNLNVVFRKCKMIELKEPYIPSFLAFRECPPLVQLVKECLSYKNCPKPDILLFDGNGELHTRGYGAACHFGYLLNIPTIGVAKDYFWIKDLPFNKESISEKSIQLNQNRGDYILLKGKSGKIWAVALRSGDDASEPIFISVGHNISLKTALFIVRYCCKNDRIPEPTRIADFDSRQFIKNKQYN